MDIPSRDDALFGLRGLAGKWWHTCIACGLSEKVDEGYRGKVCECGWPWNSEPMSEPVVVIAAEEFRKVAWMPIESVPRDTTRVLLWDGEQVVSGWLIVHEAGDEEFCVDQPGFGEDYKPTHWMPFPDPPK